MITTEVKPKEEPVQAAIKSVQPVQEEPRRQEVVKAEEPVQREPEQVVAVPETKQITYRICGQVFNTYILVEKDDQLYLVDQHAAHERLRYEELLTELSPRCCSFP